MITNINHPLDIDLGLHQNGLEPRPNVVDGLPGGRVS
jgi:hypothetical protein